MVRAGPLAAAPRRAAMLHRGFTPVVSWDLYRGPVLGPEVHERAFGHLRDGPCPAVFPEQDLPVAVHDRDEALGPEPDGREIVDRGVDLDDHLLVHAVPG